MAMKKKFLGLALAGAMTLSANGVYAANKTVQFNDNESYDHNVTVSGLVKTKTGEVPQGKLEVELPTAMNFSVDEKGQFIGSEFTVKNKSTSGIDVFVSDFQEGNGNITVKPKTEITGDSASFDRSNVYLELTGNVGGKNNTVDLASLKSIDAEEDKKILNVSGKNAGLITLTGGAGTGTTADQGVDQSGASEDFTLLFKIKKDNK